MTLQDGVSRVAIKIGVPRGYRIVRYDHDDEQGAELEALVR